MIEKYKKGEIQIEEIFKYIDENGDKGFYYPLIKNLKKEDLEKLENKIIETKDPLLCYCLARKKGANVKKLGEVILKYAPPLINVKFFKIKGADKEKHRQKVLESKNVVACITLAEIDKLHVKEYGKVILENADAIDNLYFITLKGSDVKAHEQNILENGTVREIISLIKSPKTNTKKASLGLLKRPFKIIKKNLLTHAIIEKKHPKTPKSKILKKHISSNKTKKQ